MAEEDVSVRFGAQLNELNRGFAEAQSRLKEFSDTAASHVESVNAAFETLKHAIEGFAAVMAGGIFKAFIDDADHAIDETLQISQRLGITTEQASGFRTALGNVGLTTEDVLGTLQRMDRQLRANEDSFTALGIVTRDQNGQYRDQTTILLDVISKLETYKSGTDRNEAAMTLLGGRVGDLTNLLRLNKEVLAQGSEEAQKLGLVFGDDAVKGMLAYRQAVDQADEVLLAVKVRIAQELQPTLIGLAHWMQSEGPNAANATAGAFQRLLIVFTDLKTGIELFTNEFERYAAIAGRMVDGGKNVVPDIKALSSIYDAQAKQIEQSGKRAYYAIFGLDENGKPLPVPDVKLPAQGSQTFQGDPNLIAQREKQADDDAMKAYVASTMAKEEAAHGHYEVVMELEQEMLDRLRDYYGEDSQQYQTALREQERMLRQHTDQMNRDFKRFAIDPIKGGWDEMVSGLMSGTETWGQAFDHALSDMLTRFIETVGEMIAEWAVFEATQGAGIFGFGESNPFDFLGGAAGIAEFFPAFDVGSWNIPQDTLATVHKGEMIIPASAAASVREGGGFGGDSYTINISAIDTQTGAQFLMKNGAAIAHALSGQARNFNPRVPAWKA